MTKNSDNYDWFEIEKLSRTPKISNELIEWLKQGEKNLKNTDKVKIIVTMTVDNDIALLKEVGMDVIRSTTHLPIVSGLIGVNMLKELMRLDCVVRIELDGTMKAS